MKKVAIVSCDKWIGKLEEDNNLKTELIKLELDVDIISWQQALYKDYDLLVIRSVWGYQNYYNEFKEWLLYIKNNNICLVNNLNIILDNIRKDIQFDILKRNDIDFIDTIFLNEFDILNENILKILDDKLYVVKPTISGSGENTFLIDNNDNIYFPNMIKREELISKCKVILDNNCDCKIMLQPFVSEINNGEYSCVFIDGKLTHTMVRFPNIFHEKKRPFLINDVPELVIELANRVEKISEFKDYLYMRVDIVLIDGVAKIMEVELTDPDLLTKYIDDETLKLEIIKNFAQKIKKRVK